MNKILNFFHPRVQLSKVGCFFELVFGLRVSLAHALRMFEKAQKPSRHVLPKGFAKGIKEIVCGN